MNRSSSVLAHLVVLSLSAVSLSHLACVGGIGPSDSASSSASGPGATSGTSGMSGQKAPAAPAFEPIPPAVYAAKAKDVLTGLALTDEERRAVTADPAAAKAQGVLRGLIDQWMETDAFRTKAFHFFKNAFQQTQLDRSDLEDQLRLSELPGPEGARLMKSVEDMFALTVLDLIKNNRPFTETVTTTRFMMNTPLMAALAYMDAAPRGDAGQAMVNGYWLMNRYGGAKTFKVQLVTNADPVSGVVTPIPLEESINPAHPNFMKFTFRQPDPTKYTPCKDVLVAAGAAGISYAMRALYGGRQLCQGAQNEPPIFTDADWNNWRMVEVRTPKNDDERTVFWDVTKLRKSNELVTSLPRVGFMTTVAFFANWPTNPSNQYRVTLNQALIVALNKSFDDRNNTVQVAETSVDAMHVTSGSVCYACHVTLDPMRDFFKQSYSLYYFQQLDTNNPKNPLPQQAAFVVDDVPATRGVGIETLAKAMAAHPRFATGWTQKLCTLANSEECVEAEPEFQRVADLFRKSNFNFRTLVRELFSSPLVTFASRTQTSDTHGVVMSIARRETFCARLSHRLGGKDLCNMNGESSLPRIAGPARNLSLGVPGSAYSRADERPMMPHDPNLFFISGTEKLCAAVATQLIDGGPTNRWTSKTQKDQAVVEFTEALMGIPASDPKHDAVIDILNRHYDAAIAAKEIPTEALRSTFTVACSSPLGISQGL